MTTCPLIIDGAPVHGDVTYPVFDKFNGTILAQVSRASRAQVADAVQSAMRAFKTRPLSPYERYTILRRAAALLVERKSAFVESIVAEAGFTISDAGAEVARAEQTLLLSGEEAKRLHGEMVPLDGAPDVTNRIGFTIRVPVGVVCAITPFNSPLNTVAHKVAPALGAGNTVVLKPATVTPLTAARFCQLMSDAGLPPGHLNLVNGDGSDVGAWLLDEPDVRFYTFTGSTAVGRLIQRGAGLRRTQLELGSISSTIVCEDANINWALPRCVNSSFRKAGQVCTSVQRLFVHEDILDRFVGDLIERIEQSKVGDPREPDTLVGPMISEREAARVEAWVHEAASQGAQIATGGRRDAALFYPTVLVNARPSMKVMCEEIFGPVISIVPFRNLDEALRQVNDTPFGLAAGVFTQNLNYAMAAARQLEVGAVHVNETSSSRIDLMPYGGVKESGFGREGPRYAMREMTDERLITMTWQP